MSYKPVEKAPPKAKPHKSRQETKKMTAPVKYERPGSKTRS